MSWTDRQGNRLAWYRASLLKRVACALVAFLAAFGAGGVAGAHSTLKSSDPAEGARLKEMPRVVELTFTEPLEVPLSTFKVYPLPAPAEALADPQRLNGLAAELVSRVLTRKGDESDRADAGLQIRENLASHVVLRLKPNLKPGAYVVMWQVLSVDTHVTRGFFVFVYAP